MLSSDPPRVAAASGTCAGNAVTAGLSGAASAFRRPSGHYRLTPATDQGAACDAGCIGHVRCGRRTRRRSPSIIVTQTVAALPRPGVGPVADTTIHPAGVRVTLAKRFRPSQRVRRTRARAGTRPWGIDNAAASFDAGVAAIRRLRSDERFRRSAAVPLRRRHRGKNGALAQLDRTHAARDVDVASELATGISSVTAADAPDIAVGNVLESRGVPPQPRQTRASAAPPGTAGDPGGPTRSPRS